MSDFSGYPPAECPACENLADLHGPVDPFRQFGPGEWAHYNCAECGLRFQAIVPEPPDGYEGDGVFSDNH